MKHLKTPQSESLGAISDTAEHTSGWVDLEDATDFACTLSWSGGSSPVGTFKLQVNNAEDPADGGAADLSPSSSISGNSGALELHDAAAAYRWVRAHVQLSSGSFTPTAHFNRKG